MALVTTVSTTPLTTVLYPPWYQKKLEAWKRGEIDWDGNRQNLDDSREDSFEKIRSHQVRRLLVYLRLESLPSLFTFITLLNLEKPKHIQGSQIENTAYHQRKFYTRSDRIGIFPEAILCSWCTTDGVD